LCSRKNLLGDPTINSIQGASSVKILLYGILKKCNFLQLGKMQEIFTLKNKTIFVFKEKTKKF
jgi:hypothetical protein